VHNGRGREALATRASERRQMGGAAATRQSDIRVRDRTDGVAATKRGGEEGAEGIRRFFLFFKNGWGRGRVD
jgi:hypothetical protein